MRHPAMVLLTALAATFTLLAGASGTQAAACPQPATG